MSTNEKGFLNFLRYEVRGILYKKLINNDQDLDRIFEIFTQDELLAICNYKIQDGNNILNDIL
ncbi:MAG: hypothetical protein P857_638 [Candidatus Xenolissoclinum pacificiensis L6]|uniref:Uncharacterized protein n=1 Tax=Candidatus Xenolissoclinum pacificiensis L6 TaxID=1401685 RepID=W2UYF4_9RICK|nr:MAG: hypothetical protein P857_638 [Candidatus Xenolissoclinum pacificiensis L6]